MAVLLTELPTNDAGVPVNLLRAGTDYVVILDDTPNPTLTLRVHPAGHPESVVFIDHAELGLIEPETTYYAVLAAGSTRDDPAGIVRRIHTSPMPIDEAFGRNMQWHPTEYLRRYFLGHNDDDHEEITAEQAQAVIDRWCAKWGQEERRSTDESAGGV
ncbi:hypothetical protein A5768_11320 [Mycolicibacterium fortuitum]|nr:MULTISPECIES: hypothetical protein [Mycolicibacterium]MCV6998669.1 hypothetical protein [Mycolicibacterium alvei]OBG12082.1 hypothetical protein A5768_11320 [Mycolicibacterium fortuitum]